MKLSVYQSCYLSLILGMWHHTRDLVGAPGFDEAKIMLSDWPKHKRIDAIIWLFGMGVLG